MIRIYDGRGDGKPLHVLDKLHKSPVHLIVVRPWFSPTRLRDVLTSR